jgi:hypothetical protein
MITEEQLAAAIVAKMAGSELSKVDSQTIQQSSTGPATRIDPKKFLTGIQQHQESQQQQIIAQANRAAEMAFPIHQQDQLPLAPAVQTVVPSQTSTSQDPNQLTFDFLDEATQKKSLKQLDLIVDYLYSINNKLDRILNKQRD